MKKIEFYEVTLGSKQVYPLMLPKYFSSFEFALAYARKFRDNLISKTTSGNSGFILKAITSVFRDRSFFSNAKFTMVFQDFNGTLLIYDIFIKHYIYEISK